MKIIDPSNKPLPDCWNWERMTQEFYELSALDESYFRLYEWDSGYANLGPWMFGNTCGSKCDRFLGYFAIGEEGNASIRTTLRRIFEIGTWWHFRLQMRCRVMYGDDVQIEPKAYDSDIQMATKCDAILRKVHGLEIKTISGRGFEQVKAQQYPNSGHLDQAILTMGILGLETDLFVYVNKQVNKQGFYDELPLLIPFNQPRYHQLRERIQSGVLHPIAQGLAPLPTRGGHCRECPFQEPCQANRFGT
jgi:hypothetical protein